MRKPIAWLLALSVLLSLALSAGAEGEEITVTNYDAQCTISADGQATMTVTVAVDIPSPVTQLDLPIGSGTGGSVAGLDTKSVKTDEGTFLRLTNESGISGQRTFVLTYILPRAVTTVGQGQRLSLELIAPGWAWPMDAASFAVSLPEAFTAQPVYVGGYYGDLVEDYLVLDVSANGFAGQTAESLRDHDSLQVTLELPANYVSLGSAGGLSGTVTLLILAALGLLGLLYWYRTLYYRRTPVRMRPIPPDGAGAGDLPLLDTCAAPSLPLQVMQWASMGYLAIHAGRRGRVVLRRTMPMGSERRKQEQAVFAMLFGDDGWCDIESRRFGQLGRRYADAMRPWWQRRIFSHSSGSPALLHLLAALASGTALLGMASAGLPVSRFRIVLLVLFGIAGIVFGVLIQHSLLAAVRKQYRKAAVGAVLILAELAAAWFCGGLLGVLLSIVMQLLSAWATIHGGRRSRAGRESLAQITGFRRYLRQVGQNQLVILLRGDSQYFYKLLPFAEALGQGAAFCDCFGEIEMEPCAWLERDRRVPRTAPTFYPLFLQILQRMEHTVSQY